MSRLKRILLIGGGAAAVMVAVLAVFLVSRPAPGPDGTASRPENPEGRAAEADSFGEVPGAAGHIRFPGTDIDGPVMIAEDNEYFLRRDEQGNEDIWGCYFLDCECTPGSQNLIAYGHSLEDSRDGQRFSQLKKLYDAGFAAENNRIYLTVRGIEYEYEIFSHGVVPAGDDSIVINANPTDAQMRDIVNGAIERSAHDYKANVSGKDNLLTLATCTSGEGQRFVVVARRLEV